MARHVLSWMDDRVHPNTIQALRDAGADGGWMGLTEEQLAEGDALQEALSALLDGVTDDRAEDLLGRVARWNGEDAPVTVDPLEIALGRRTGTDMLAALCVVDELRRMVPATAFVRVIRGPARRTDMTLTVYERRVIVGVPLSPEAQWKDGVLTIARVLPEAMQIAVTGKPLSLLVSHALLDPLGLTIDRIDTVGQSTKLVTSHRPELRPIDGFTHADLASDDTALDTPAPRRGGGGNGGFESPF